MQKFINLAVLAAVLFASAPAFADGFGTPGVSDTSVGFGTPAVASTSIDPLPEGTWGLIIQSNVNWNSGTLGQGSVFSSDPTQVGTVDSVSTMVEDVNLSTATTAGPECGISCDAVNISLDGTWNAGNIVTATMNGTGAGTIALDGTITPFTAGAMSQSQGLINMTGAFDYTYGPDVVVPVPDDN